jgi:hypothetical protein
VVVVSADPGWRSYATAHTVEPFSRAESVALLTARRPDLPVDDAVRIAAAVDDLPPAVDLAAGLLAQSGMSPESFLRLLSHRRACGDPIAATWEIVIDRLDVGDPFALSLLTLVAWLDPEPVPVRVLAEHPDVLPAAVADVARAPAVLAERISDLGRQGLIRVTAAGVRLPRQPAALLVARTANARIRDGGWADAVVRLLRAAVPEDPADPAGRAGWRSLLPLVLAATDPARRLDGAAADVAWLLRRAASYLDTRGQRRTAEVLVHDANDVDPVRQPPVADAVANPSEPEPEPEPDPELCEVGQHDQRSHARVLHRPCTPAGRPPTVLAGCTAAPVAPPGAGMADPTPQLVLGVSGPGGTATPGGAPAARRPAC